MPRYTRKDYELVAETIRATRAYFDAPADVIGREFSPDTVLSEFARRMAQEFSNDNGRFNPQQFRDACNR